MSKLAYMADYRKPKESLSININCKLDSKKACELLQDDHLRALLRSNERLVSINGQEIILNKEDIYTELAKRD